MKIAAFNTDVKKNVSIDRNKKWIISFLPNYWYNHSDIIFSHERIDMPPEKFTCRQCGQCCINLSGAFQTTVSDEDVAMWEMEGRYDILEWVDSFPLGDDAYIHDIWIHPEHGEDVSRCPWLRKLPGKEKYICRIHDLKPEHCRNYPKSKKHAQETGCNGFEKN